MSTKPWTEAHQTEADVRRYELSAELRRIGKYREVRLVSAWDTCDEYGFRLLLVDAGFGGARVKAEVRRVRAVAEGRLVRETVWRVQYFTDEGNRAQQTADLSREEAIATRDRMRAESGWRGRIVRVTRTRPR